MSLTEPPPVQVKADRIGFTLVPDPAASFDSIVGYMRQRLEQSHDFFHKTDMVLDLRTKPLRTDEITALYEILFDKARVKLVEVRLTEDLSFVVEGEMRRQRMLSRGSTPERENDAPVIVRTPADPGSGSFPRRIVSSW